MKIAVTATGNTLESSLDPRFGRCRFFLVVEIADLSFEPMVNPNVSRDSAAGIQAAQLLANTGIQFVITGNCGPNAYQTLTAAGIGVIVGCSGTVRSVIEEFKNGRYSTVQEPNVASHFGVGASSTASGGEPTQRVRESQFAMGMGIGRGGTGMGMNRGTGRGGGRGLGQGAGRGGGQGVGRGRMARDPAPARQPQPTSPSRPETAQELDALKAQAREVEAQLAALKDEIGQIAQTSTVPRLIAIVDEERCLACGRCVESCPAGAITLDAVAVVDTGKCTGCGQCVVTCPQEAIVLKGWRE